MYKEAGNATNPAGYLNLAWSRVTDPSGTTLMDFEFNQSGTSCASGPNKVRTTGDLLIEYTIDQGGARADITARKWTGSAWGPTQDLDAPSLTCADPAAPTVPKPCAAGTINSSAIPAAQSDGIISSGQLNARTFGEAQIDLRTIFQPNQCTSFGSAMLKSRSSDSFTSQLKDFIRPVDTNITNCGKVIIRKQTDPDENPNATNFGYTKSFGTQPTTPNTFTLQDDGVKTFANVLFGTGYTVTEDVIPSGWDFKNLDCSASTGVTPSINGATVTFSVDNADDVLDCTYTNTKRGHILIDKVTDPSGSPQKFDFTLTGGPAGGTVNQSFQLDDDTPHDSGAVKPGTYNAAETVPAGWNLDEDNTSCDDGSEVNAIDLAAGETVTCTFTNVQQRGNIVVDKVTNPSGDPQKFDFTLTGGPSNLNQSFKLDDDDTPHTSGSVIAGSGYDVSETVPPGWDLTSATCDQGETNLDNITVNTGETVTCTFTNTKKITTIGTSQSFTPQDTVTIGGTGSGTFNGQVDFELYKGEGCSGTPVYFEKNVSLPGSGTLKTTNGGPAGPNHSAEYTISGDGTGEYHWKVSYHDDTNGHPSDSSCIEESTVTIDNDNRP